MPPAIVELFRWQDLIAYLEAHHTDVQTFPGDRLRMTYRHEGRNIPFGGYILRAPSGAAWLVVAIKLCADVELRPRPALVANSDLPVGTISLLANFGVLRQSLPLEGLRSDHLELVLSALSKLSVEMRAGYGDAQPALLEDDDSPYSYIYR